MNRQEHFKFRLFVDGKSANAAQAIANLNRLCHERLPDRHEIEIVDVTLQPKWALTDGILLTPTLVKLEPLPIRKIVGTLSQMQPLLHALGLPSAAP
jgi:circadian clock protein KaiB